VQLKAENFAKSDAPGYISSSKQAIYKITQKRIILHRTVFIAEITGTNQMVFARFSPMLTNIQPTLQPLVPYTDPAHQARRAKPLISGQGRGPMGRIPRPKGLRAGVGFLERGQPSQPPAYQLEGLGSAVSSPSGVRGGTPAAKKFSCILEAPGSLPRNLLGAKFGVMAPWPS